MAILHGVIDKALSAVESIGPMHYRLVFDDTPIFVRESGAVVDHAMKVAEHPPGVEIFCG